jgi:hypothetical protein
MCTVSAREWADDGDCRRNGPMHQGGASTTAYKRFSVVVCYPATTVNDDVHCPR